jgi:PHP family Zn ribbon phosphoesterase
MQDAVERLAEVLAQENAALKRMDFPAAVAMVPAKEAALAAMARDATTAATRSAAIQALAGLAEENQILLARAIEVQTRIVRMVARAIAPSRQGAHYKRPNEGKTAPRTMALALSKSV